MLVVAAHPHRRDHYVPLGLSSDPMIFEPGASNFCQHNADACQSRERAPGPMSGSDCPNGMCSRKPTGAAAETYGKPAAGKLEAAVFALG